MVEMRWVPLNKSNSKTPHAFRNLADDYLVLQYRQKLVMGAWGTIPPIDAPTGWSEWIDVPTQTEE